MWDGLQAVCRAEAREAGINWRARYETRSHRHRGQVARLHQENLRGPRPNSRSCRGCENPGREDGVSQRGRCESRAAPAALARIAGGKIYREARRRNPSHLLPGRESAGASRSAEEAGISIDQRVSCARRARLPRRVFASVRRPRRSHRVEREAMIEGFEEGSLVIANLVTPKEKFFGVLIALSPAGITLRAINLDSFDDWLRQIAKGDEPSLDLITMFVPLFRVERIFLDEPSGAIKSYAQRFEETVGMTVHQYLNLQ